MSLQYRRYIHSSVRVFSNDFSRANYFNQGLIKKKPRPDAECGIIHTQVSGEKLKKKTGETPALTLEGRGNDLVVFVTCCFCCSQVFSVLYTNTSAGMHGYLYSVFYILF
jgi:hypothetical protein